MRILLVWASAAWSIRDVTTGLRGALVRAGHQVRDYRLDNRLEIIAKGIPEEWKATKVDVSRMATDGVLAEASYFGVDLVLIVSGMLFHELGLWLLQKYGFRTAIVLTESPYEDEAQHNWLARYPEIVTFTHERTSAAKYGWHYLPHAYNPEVHRPVEADPDESSDVLFVGTGFGERQQQLESIDWTGIDLRLRGLWPGLKADSSLWPYYVPGCIENAQVPRLYAAAKIALNPYRKGDGAESLNPRAYELAACGTFQISDYRAESAEVFGDAVPTYRDTGELASLIRYYLDHEQERLSRAAVARERVQEHTFDRRVAGLIAAVTPAAVG